MMESRVEFQFEIGGGFSGLNQEKTFPPKETTTLNLNTVMPNHCRRFFRNRR